MQSRQGKENGLGGRGLKPGERIRGALFGGAIGDALGYPVEFRGAKESFIQDMILDKKTNQALISDDTQMTLFTACGLLYGEKELRTRESEKNQVCVQENKRCRISAWEAEKDWMSEQIVRNSIADAYQDWLNTQEPDYTKNPGISWLLNIPELYSRRAPGLTCLSALQKGGGCVEEPINNSKGCGGVMRIAPIPLYGAVNGRYTQEQNGRLCAEAAAVTHGHPLGWLSSVALGNILYDIMLDFSLEYAVEDTIRFLEENYAEYGHSKQMIRLLEKAVELAAAAGKSDAVNLMEEFNVTSQLGEGWVGEEALAVGLFCVLVTQKDGAEKCLWNAVGHKGDSDSTGSIAGQIWGAYFGEQSLPKSWMDQLELHDVIEKIADDLEKGC